MHDGNLGHQAISGDSRRHRRTDSNVFVHCHPTSEGLVADDDMLNDAQPVECLDEPDEMLARTVHGLAEIDVADLHC
jgi:hypothetical protein